jgi:conjugal transfer pilus assembly protein TraV
MKSFSYAICLCLSLSACSVKNAVNPYDEDFHCRATDSEGRCTDTPNAYRSARHPESKESSGENSVTVTPLKIEAKASQYKAIADLLESPKAPLMNPPKVLRVLILPYRGEKNELFMSRYAYVEIEKSTWILTDAKEKN